MSSEQGDKDEHGETTHRFRVNFVLVYVFFSRDLVEDATVPSTTIKGAWSLVLWLRTMKRSRPSSTPLLSMVEQKLQEVNVKVQGELYKLLIYFNS